MRACWTGELDVLDTDRLWEQAGLVNLMCWTGYEAMRAGWTGELDVLDRL